MPLRFRVRPPNVGAAPALERTVDVEPAGGEVRIGRQPGSEIELPFATVSIRHARLLRQGGAWLLSDSGSANGTFVADRRLAARVPEPLSPGDIFRIADVVVVFEGERRAAGGAAVPAESTATLARRLVSDLFGGHGPAEVPRLHVEAGPAAGQTLALTAPGRLYRVGRAAHCDLIVADEDVSREHAGFERTWEGVVVRDLGSKNGVEVAGERLSGTRRVHDGAVVVLGDTRLRLDDPEERYLRRIQVEAEREQDAGEPRTEPAVGGLVPAIPETAAAVPTALQPAAREDFPMTALTASSRGGGPAAVVIAGLALVVVGGVLALVLWLLLGRW